MEKDPAIWSRQFARNIGKTMGFSIPETALDNPALQQEVEKLLSEMKEDFRYLPLEQWNWIENMACFLKSRELAMWQAGEDQVATAVGVIPLHRCLDKLREIRSYVAFLRSSFGLDQPADESDEWTDEEGRTFGSTHSGVWTRRIPIHGRRI